MAVSCPCPLPTATTGSSPNEPEGNTCLVTANGSTQDGGHGAPEELTRVYLRSPPRSRGTPWASLLPMAHNKSEKEMTQGWQGQFSCLTWLCQPLPAAQRAPGAGPAMAAAPIKDFIACYKPALLLSVTMLIRLPADNRMRESLDWSNNTSW